MMTFDPVKFGKRLKEIRALRGLTQEQLAGNLDIIGADVPAILQKTLDEIDAWEAKQAL